MLSLACRLSPDTRYSGDDCARIFHERIIHCTNNTPKCSVFVAIMRAYLRFFMVQQACRQLTHLMHGVDRTQALLGVSVLPMGAEAKLLQKSNKQAHKRVLLHPSSQTPFPPLQLSLAPIPRPPPPPLAPLSPAGEICHKPLFS